MTKQLQKYLIGLIMCLTTTQSHGQGFLNFFDFDSKFSTFLDIQQLNDRIFALGQISFASPFTQGFIISKIDSFGYDIENLILIDTLFAFDIKSGQNFSKDKFENFYFSGDVFDRTNLFWAPFICKVNSNLEIVYLNHLPKAPPGTVEVLKGSHFDGVNWNLFGLYQSISTLDIQALQITCDSMGNRLSTKNYGNPNVTNSYGNYFINGPNSTYIGSFEDDRTWIFEIDSLGEIVWEWKDNQIDNSSVAYDLLVVGDSIFYTSGQNGNLLGPSLRPIFGCISKSTGEVLFQKFIGEEGGSFNKLNSITKRPDSDEILLSGSKHIRYLENNTTVSYVGAYHHVVNYSGDSLWARFDTFNIYSDEPSSLLDIYSTTLLSSGSIVSCGQGVYFGEERYGILMKINKNGCMTLPCDLTTSTELVSAHHPKPNISLHPNPTSDYLFFSGIEDQNHAIRFEIYDMQGIARQRGEITHPEEGLYIGTLQSDLYLIKLRLDQGEVTLKFTISK